MKLKSTLLAATLLVFAASTATSFAVEEHPADASAKGTPVGVPLQHSDPAAAKAEKTEAAKTEAGEAKKPVKKVKRHSHMEEKTGMPAPEPASGKSHRETMDKDMPMHDHTQDRH